MPLHGRARYNLQRSQMHKDPYRDMSLNELLAGVCLDVESFTEAAKEVDTPEELAEKLELDEEGYLSIFELWRRLDTRETISIFCDELDYVMDEYERHPEENEEILAIKLGELVDILDVHVDEGYKPKHIFKEISNYLAHDLASFLLKFISEQIDRGNSTVASELLDDFSEYLEHNVWMDFLRIKLLHGATLEVASAMMARFLEKLKERPDVELYFHLLRYLMETGDTDLFSSNFREALKFIKSEDHFLELLGIVFDYFNRHDCEKEEELIKELISERKRLSHHGEVSSQDKEKIRNLVV